MNLSNYALRYTLETENRPEGYEKEDASDGKGLTDSLIVISIIHPEEGGYSQALFTYDGLEGRELTQKEIFKAWLMLGLSLHDTGELKGWQSDLVEMNANIFRSMFNHNHDCASTHCASTKGN